MTGLSHNSHLYLNLYIHGYPGFFHQTVMRVQLLYTWLSQFFQSLFIGASIFIYLESGLTFINEYLYCFFMDLVNRFRRFSPFHSVPEVSGEEILRRERFVKVNGLRLE